MSDGSIHERSNNTEIFPEKTDHAIVVPQSFLDQTISIVTVPLARYLMGIPWITPNQISWLSGGLGGPLAGGLIIQEHNGLAVFFIILSGILDSLDGDLARQRGTASVEGDILDSVIDRYVDFFLIAALILASPEAHLIPGLLALLGSTLVPYIRARSEADGKSTVASIGDRATRTVLLIIGLLTGQIFALLIILAAISNIAAIHRFIFALIKNDSES